MVGFFYILAFSISFISFSLMFPPCGQAFQYLKDAAGPVFCLPQLLFYVLWPSCPHILENDNWALCPLRWGGVFDQSLSLSTCALAFLFIMHLH